MRRIRAINLVFALVLLCCGCYAKLANQAADTYGDEAKVATVEGLESAVVVTGGSGSVFPFDYDCWIKTPGGAKRVIIDPGHIQIVAVCDWQAGVLSASFAFDGVAGHTYEVVAIPFSNRCLKLKDLTSKETIEKICGS